jgi:hypothetical protein
MKKLFFASLFFLCGFILKFALMGAALLLTALGGAVESF